MIKVTQQSPNEIVGYDNMTGDVIRVFIEDGAVKIHHNDVRNNPCALRCNEDGLAYFVDSKEMRQVTGLDEIMFMFWATYQLQLSQATPG